MSHPERQHLRFTVRAGLAHAGAVIATLAVAAAMLNGSAAIATAWAVIAILTAGYARRQRRLARRWGIGARSERTVRGILDGLARQPGFTIRHNLTWRGHGDIDHAVRTPEGLVLAIDTKTRTVRPEHVAKMPGQAREACRRLRGTHAAAVICVTAAHHTWQQVDGVTIISADQLLRLIREARTGR